MNKQQTKITPTRLARIEELQKDLNELNRAIIFYKTSTDEQEVKYLSIQADFIKLHIASLRGKNPRRVLTCDEYANAQKYINGYCMLAERPVYYGQKGRAQIGYWRACSAWNLAERVNGDYITVEEFERAQKLLNRIIKYALADAHEFERANDNERYYNSNARKDAEKKLDARRERLQKDLARYGLYLYNYGLYPTICDEQTRQPSREVSLYFFN